jgi:hypothetical protein
MMSFHADNRQGEILFSHLLESVYQLPVPVASQNEDVLNAVIRHSHSHKS